MFVLQDKKPRVHFIFKWEMGRTLLLQLDSPGSDDSDVECAVTQPLPPLLISGVPSAGVPATAAVTVETLALLQEKWVKQGRKGPSPMEKAGGKSPRKTRF